MQTGQCTKTSNADDKREVCLIMWINLAAATAYFYFNWRYFSLVGAVHRQPRYAKFWIIGAFFLNYAMFYICSTMEMYFYPY